MSTPVTHHVEDLALADVGIRRVEWADQEMPVLREVRARFEQEQPFKGLRISACLDVTAETANLMRTLKAGGADAMLCASNPLSTQDDVAAALVAEYGIPVFAINGADDDTYYRHIMAVADHRPHVTMDDGADLVGVLHTTRRELLGSVLAGTAETTAGVLRLRAMEGDAVLRFPIIAVNEAQTTQLFDNRYGTGQSVIDGILRATNVLLAGSTFVVAGYGWCGRGLAERARGMGAHVIVLEVDAMRALQAAMDGFRVMTAEQAAPLGDVFCTATGTKNVLRGEHFDAMKDAAIIANAGHITVEIDVPTLRARAVAVTQPRPFVEQLTLANGRTLMLLAEGRLVNLVAAEGHPVAVMDVRFANQALAAEYVVKHADTLEMKVYVVPPVIDVEIARLKLASLGVEIDVVSAEQERFRQSWTEGT